ncbi:hypothetical protein VspSTUT11_20540 [Vibrio sp. STUT-A11]|nr:hypothetical protein VspSTUT11_20540 [Vibrio sp. STUT-A11]
MMISPKPAYIRLITEPRIRERPLPENRQKGFQITSKCWLRSGLVHIWSVSVSNLEIIYSCLKNVTKLTGLY